MDQLESMKSELAELLRDNESLPSNEQLELRAFSLDETAREALLQREVTHVARERAARETRYEEQQLAVQAVLHECWHRMLVKPRSIKAMDGSLSIRNFAIAPDENSSELQYELARHELVLSVTRLISFKPWQTMTDSELEQRLNASPLDRRSFKSVAEGVQRLLGELSLAQARASATTSTTVSAGDTPEQSSEDTLERAVQSGSTTHRLLVPELSAALSLVLPFQQIELNVGAHEAAKHALLLTAIIRDLKCLFNTEFDELWLLKEKELLRFHDVAIRLKEILTELREKGKEALLCLPQWDSTEKPELVVEQEKVEEPESNSSEHSIRSGTSFCGRALTVMMDNRVETRWQERLAREPTPPPCLAKDTHLWTEEDRSAMESYERRVAGLRAERDAYTTKLSQERSQLLATLKEGSQKLDVALERLARRRLDIEAAIRQEELKVARIKLWSLARADALRQECRVRQELKEREENLEKLSEKRLYLLASYESKRKYHEALLAHDRQQAQSFRREFTHLSPMVVDQLAKWYKKRPAVQLSAMQLRLLSQKLGPLLHLSKDTDREETSMIPPMLQNDSSEPWRMYMSALRSMDNTNLASTNVDAATWALLCRLRRVKAEAEIRVKASALDVAEAEASLSSLDACLMADRRRQRALTADLVRAVGNKRRLLLDTEVQLLLPRGKIELTNLTNIGECEQAIVVPLENIRALNRDVREAGACKLSTLRLILKFRAGHVRQAEWSAKRAEAEVALLEEELAQVQRITISSEIRQYLHGTKHTRSAANKKIFEESLYLRRLEELTLAKSILRKKLHKLNQDQERLQSDIELMESTILQLRKDFVTEVLDDDKQRLRAEESRLKRNIKSQTENLQQLRLDLEKMKLRTFPTLFDVSF